MLFFYLRCLRIFLPEGFFSNSHILSNLPKVEKHGATTKKLDQAVDMAAENQNFAEMESIWKLQARDVPTVSFL